MPHSAPLRTSPVQGGPHTGLNANQLKLLAVAAMVVDHCTAILFPAVPGAWLLRLFGRLTAPVMCYFIAEGYAHTSNLRRYLGRLLLTAAVSHVPFVLCQGGLDRLFRTTGVIWTLFLGLLALAASESDRLPLWGKFLAVLGCCLLAWNADWSWYAVLWILGFGTFRRDKRRAFTVFAAVGLLYVLQDAAAPSLFTLSRCGVFLAIPVLLCYNGTLGMRSRALQYGFYWFYPVHLLLLWLIRAFLLLS